MYLTYVMSSFGEYSFIARFEYNKRDRASFQKFLMNHFTVDEYFDLLKNGSTPVAALKSKGWISPTEKKYSDLAREQLYA